MSLSRTTPSLLNLVERRLVPLAVVVFDNLKQLGHVSLTVDFFKLGTFQDSDINEHLERMPPLYGAMLFRITGNDQPAASLWGQSAGASQSLCCPER